METPRRSHDQKLDVRCEVVVVGLALQGGLLLSKRSSLLGCPALSDWSRCSDVRRCLTGQMFRCSDVQCFVTGPDVQMSGVV